jgi:uncharacterized protein YecE (DUF72 family)
VEESDAPALFSGLPADTVEPAAFSEELRALGRRIPPSVRMGTSSWSFPGWTEHVWKRDYPASMLADQGLTAYAAHPLFNTVSLDRTYYRVPDPSLYARYRDQVPPDFRFVVKAPQVSTARRTRDGDNPHRLDPDWVRSTFLDPLRTALGDRLGVVLVQFPPERQPVPDGFWDRLARFLTALSDVPVAVEVRTPAWLDGPLHAVLSDTGASPCLTVHPAMPDLRTQWKALRAGDAPLLMVRWNLGGQHTTTADTDYEQAKSAYAPFDRVVDPDEGLRAGIARAVAWAIERERPVWITANNKAEGCAPGTLEGIARRLSL